MNRNSPTESSPKLTLVSDTDTAIEKSSAYWNYGPVRAGLTNTQAIQRARLTESLNYLEKEVATLESKFYEAYAILAIDIERLVKVLRSTLDTDITREDKDN